MLRSSIQDLGMHSGAHRDLCFAILQLLQVAVGHPEMAGLLLYVPPEMPPTGVSASASAKKPAAPSSATRGGAGAASSSAAAAAAAPAGLPFKAWTQPTALIK
jgi:hypothetical protein